MFKSMLKFLKSLIKGVTEIQEKTKNFGKGYNINRKTLDLIKEFEGYEPIAYKDVVGVWTIGYGNTFYADGSKVKQGDSISHSDAEKLLRDVVDKFADQVTDEIRVQLTDCQFGALVSFTYNVGIGAFRRSTLLRKVNADPEDPAIRDEFSKWVRAGGKTLGGLVRRRKEEANLYFSENC
jgi:lysozyme